LQLERCLCARGCFRRHHGNHSSAVATRSRGAVRILRTSSRYGRAWLHCNDHTPRATTDDSHSDYRTSDRCFPLSWCFQGIAGRADPPKRRLTFTTVTAVSRCYIVFSRSPWMSQPCGTADGHVLNRHSPSLGPCRLVPVLDTFSGSQTGGVLRLLQAALLCMIPWY
jgi:hypothetical protein